MGASCGAARGAALEERATRAEGGWDEDIAKPRSPEREPALAANVARSDAWQPGGEQTAAPRVPRGTEARIAHDAQEAEDAAAEREASDAASERLTPARTALIAVALAAATYVSAESFAECARLLALANGRSPPPAPSALHAWLVGHAIELTGVPCRTRGTGERWPIFEPLGECSFGTRAYEDAATARSIGSWHAIDEPAHSFALGARLALNATHLACAAYFLALALAAFALGGARAGAARMRAKRALLSALGASACALLGTGIVLLAWRRPTEMNYPTPNETAAAALVPPPASAALARAHEAGRRAYAIVYACAHASAMLNAATRAGPAGGASRAFMGATCACLALSLGAQLVHWPVLLLKLCTLDVLEHAWAQSALLLAGSAIYPLQDGANAWALYWAEARGAPYEWREHREFNLATLTLHGVLAVLSLVVLRGPGLFFATAPPAAFQLACYAPPVAAWALARGRPHARRLRALPGAAREVRAERDEEHSVVRRLSF